MSVGPGTIIHAILVSSGSILAPIKIIPYNPQDNRMAIGLNAQHFPYNPQCCVCFAPTLPVFSMSQAILPPPTRVVSYSTLDAATFTTYTHTSPHSGYDIFPVAVLDSDKICVSTLIVQKSSGTIITAQPLRDLVEGR